MAISLNSTSAAGLPLERGLRRQQNRDDMKNFLLKLKIERELERIIYRPRHKKLLGLLTWIENTKNNNAALPFVLQVIKKF